MIRKLFFLASFLIFTSCEITTKETAVQPIQLEEGWTKTSSDCLVYEDSLEATDSLIWKGDCFENKINGFGVMEKFSNNEFIYKYEGNYINGEKLGLGKETYFNGSIYEGEFYYESHGSGKKESPDGSSFYGIFSLGEPFSGIKTSRTGEIQYLLEYDVITKERAAEIGMDKWSIKEIDYSLNNWIKPELNVTTTLYYDKDWHLISDKKEAEYYRLATFISPYKVKDNLIQDFYITGERQNKYYSKYVDINNTALEIRDGENIGYYKNGQVDFSQFYKNGKLEGKSVSYFDDGTISSEANYINGEKDGVSTTYFENGNVENEITYVNGVLNGERKYYYESGSLNTIQYSKNNDSYGDFVWYYESGEVKLKQSYTDDYMVPGERLEYNKDGSGDKVYFENWLWNYEDWEKNGTNYNWAVSDDNTLNIDQTSRIFVTKEIDMIDTDKTYSIELAFNKKSGKNLDGTGIVFNYKDMDNYTQFIVSSDGYFKVIQKFLGISKEIKPWTKSSLINKYSGENKLKVFSFEDETYYSINGKVVLKTDEHDGGDGTEYGIMADKGSFEISSFLLKQPFSKKEIEVAGNDNNRNNSSPGINRWSGSGSGIVISKNGLIATNYHVVKDSRYIEAELLYNGEIKSFKAKVIKTDEINDLAIIKIDDPIFELFDEIPYNFTTEIKKTGTKIYALGYPSAIQADGSEGLMGKEIKFTDGRISAKTGIGGSPIFYQTTAPLQGGNSGGPLFDENANLVGINTAILESDKFENVSYSVKSRFLLNLIEVLPQEVELPENYKTGRNSIEDQIEIISGFVALIKVK